VWLQVALAVLSGAVLVTDSFFLRVCCWCIAVSASASGVAYRVVYRKLSVSKDKELEVGRGEQWLFRVAFICTLAAIVLTSYRASLVIPE